VLLDVLFAQYVPCELGVVLIHELRVLSQTSLHVNLGAVIVQYVLNALLVLQSDVALMQFVLGNALHVTLNALLNGFPSLMLQLYQHLNNDELMQAFHLMALLLHLYVLLFAQLCDAPLELLL
jgi:hypothetical protein